jgi:hypothetical protein
LLLAGVGNAVTDRNMGEMTRAHSNACALVLLLLRNDLQPSF